LVVSAPKSCCCTLHPASSNARSHAPAGTPRNLAAQRTESAAQTRPSRTLAAHCRRREPARAAG
jgi:hypothetical protein